ncbi:hypothetical protein B0J17DRAFT_733750 [Rhizoctonia solani]|nr:hypothetical protein B0J17DRAFT_733750 [Rhizoctonia solani]
MEQRLYYWGIRGFRGRCPKLIYRSSNDVFVPPSDPHQSIRAMELLPVYEHDKLHKDNLWLKILLAIVGLLDKRKIKLTSIDLARFTWRELGTDPKIITTPPTIWVGVRADSLTGDVAYESCNEILNLLKENDITDIQVAYRESHTKLLVGPELFAPVDNYHHLKKVIGPLTTALGMSIAGLRTPHIQGTMGFFFRQDGKLHGVTARHVLFPEEGAGPKKEVVVLGTKAFDDLLTTIQYQIHILEYTVTILRRQAEAYSEAVAHSGGRASPEAAKLWQDLHDRVIGHVVWAPAISVSTPADGYMRDVCVIELDAEKFGDNFKGNVIDLDLEIQPGEFICAICPRTWVGAQSEFDYPLDRLFRLRDIPSATEIIAPNNDVPVQYLIKRGSTARTMIGRLNGFDSYERRYNYLGHMDSIAMAIFSYDNQSGPFSMPGDSGADLADSGANFAGLITGGTGLTDWSDITYATPMDWLWNKVIKVKYPDANLCFEE